MIDQEQLDIYSGPERRLRESMQMEAIEAIVERITKKVIAEHEVTERGMWDDLIHRAFPNDDPESHCSYHQDLIDAAAEQKKFWIAAQTKLLEKGIDGLFGVLKIVLVLALAGLAVKVGIALPFIGGRS